MRKRYFYSIIIVILFAVYYLSIGFSAVSSTARIDNIMASVEPIGLVRVTNVLASSSTNMGVINSEEYNMNDINGNIELPYSNSTVTFRVSVTVYLESIMKITDISNLNSNLEYELSGYQLGNALCDNNGNCNFGSTTEFDITIKYKNGFYDSSNTTFSINLNFSFDTLSIVARVGNSYYSSIQDAVNAVSSDGVKTTVTLLKNTSELVNIAEGKNIELNLQSFTLSNNGSTNVIINNGTLHIINGIITSSASYGAIDNNSNGYIYMSGGSIIATGARQAIYNNGGHVEISGTAYLSSSTGERCTVHNLANSYLLITGGTLVSAKKCAVDNYADFVIGVKDGNVSISNPVLQGGTYGIISSVNYSFYDGIVKGFTAPFSDKTKITDMETTFGILESTEEVNLKIYKNARLAQVYEVRFNANTGTVSEATRNVEKGLSVGVLPVPTKENYIFDGWFTSLEGGTKISKDQIILGDIEFFAHWTNAYEAKLARIGTVAYTTIQDAINDVPTDNTETTITVLGDSTELLTISKDQNIILDIGNNVINNNGVSNVIKNYGTLKIISGTIISNTTQGAINNYKGGTLIMTGGNIITSGTRQAIYNDGGVATISGTAYLSSTSTERGTVQNLNGGTMTILGGTIISVNFNGVENTANLIIGSKDGDINSSSPVIRGKKYGVNNSSSFKFYDGIIKGNQASINGNINEMEDNSIKIDSTETINGYLYHTSYLEADN